MILSYYIEKKVDNIIIIARVFPLDVLANQ